MAISWHITLGYNSGHTGKTDWEQVCDIARDLASQSEYLFELAYDTKQDSVSTQMISEVAKTYQAEKGNPLVILKDSINILASGGGEWREAKEHVARGFVRALMERVHGAGFDINIQTG